MSEKSMAKAAPEPQAATAAAPQAMDAQACAERAVRRHEHAMHQQAMQRAPMTASAAAAGEAAYHHHHHHAKAEPQGGAGQGVAGQSVAGQGGVGQGLVEKEARSILPSVSSVVQAGAFGAALGGMTTGVMEMARVKQGEITTDEAIRNVVKSSA